MTVDDKLLAFIGRVEYLIDAASARGLKAERFKELYEQIESEIGTFDHPLDPKISKDTELRNRIDVLLRRLEKLLKRASILSELPSELQKHVAGRYE